MSLALKIMQALKENAPIQQIMQKYGVSSSEVENMRALLS